jgi:hypothetical protein
MRRNTLRYSALRGLKLPQGALAPRIGGVYFLLGCQAMQRFHKWPHQCTDPVSIGMAALVLAAVGFCGQVAATDSSQARSDEISQEAQLRYDCAKFKIPVAQSICGDVRSKYKECVIYNERLGNQYDCSQDKTLLEWQELAQSAEKKYSQASKPNAKIGMTKKQVVEKSSWGEPAHINTTILNGHVKEQWVYGDGDYIYFDNGRVVAIQTSR